MLELFFRKGELLTDFKSECMCMRIYTNAYLSLGFPGGFPGGSDGKESAYNAAGPGSIPGLGRSPGEGNRYPLQYSCLKNSMDRGAWQATVRGVAKSWTQLSNQHFHFFHFSK